MDLELKDKVFFLSASSKGLGFAIAQNLAKEGAKVFLGSSSSENLKNARLKLLSQNISDDNIRFATMDNNDRQSVNNWIEQGLEVYGRVDGLLINTGGPKISGFLELSDEEWDQAYFNLLGATITMIRKLLPRFRMQQSGVIAAITSSSVVEPIDRFYFSNVYRAGISNLMKTLANEFSHENIRFIQLVPGTFATDRLLEIDANLAKNQHKSSTEIKKQREAAIPMGRYGDPDEFGRLAAILLSPRSAYFTGQSLIIDGGKMRSMV